MSIFTYFHTKTVQSARKMPQNSKRVKTLLMFLLIFGSKSCDAQMITDEEASSPAGGSGNAFFALRSCHQVLSADSAEFFSPDYLCSNPPLWCNWTIRVEPGRRVRLFLEDLTGPDVCHLKRDQIHVDEPAGVSGGHRVLQRCWREARYISASNTLYVVLLIGGHPAHSYRGFHGRYQAFGPPAVYNPPDGFAQSGRTPWADPTEQPLAQRGFTESLPMINGEQVELFLPEGPAPPALATYDPVYDYYDQLPEENPAGQEGAPAGLGVQYQEGGNQHLAYESAGGSGHAGEGSPPTTTTPAQVAPTQGAPRTGRDAPPTRSGRPADADVLSPSPDRRPHSSGTGPPMTAAGGNVDALSRDGSWGAVAQNRTPTPGPPAPSAWGEGSEPLGGGGNGTVLEEATDSPPDGVSMDPEGSLPRAHPNVGEPLADHHRNGNGRNQSAFPHLPGDHLFEVAVEMTFPQDHEDHWDHVARSLLLSVKALVSERLEGLHAPKSTLSKRIKRLSAGVLYILWLQIAEAPGGPQVHRTLHAALQDLIETVVELRGSRRQAVVISVSTADVNECGTQMVLCDANAVCVNRFGSYSCHCQVGFQDVSRLGVGGTLCVDPKASACRSGASAALTRGVYVVFFLLSSLILTLLVGVGVLYHRHHRGAFPVRCRSDSLTREGDRRRGSPTGDQELPPPPPPVRRPKGSWSHPRDCCPPSDLPLLRFSPVLPLDGYMEPEDGGEKK